MHPKAKLSGRLALGAAVVLALAVLADAVGITKPAASPRQVLQEMTRAWDAASAYHAEVSTGQWGNGAAGAPLPSRQWYWKEADELVLGTQDLAGFRHAERWRGSRWSYYQPGAEIQADVQLTGEEPLPYARWLVTNYPTVGDLVAVIRDARNHRVTGQEPVSTGRAWILECEPLVPQLDPSLPGSHPARKFYARLLGQPWKVWISQRTHLPEHLMIRGSGSLPAARIGVDNLRLEAIPPFADWKQAVDKAGRRPRIVSLSCDLRSADELEGVRKRIQETVDAWRKPLLRNFSRPQSARSADPF